MNLFPQNEFNENTSDRPSKTVSFEGLSSLIENRNLLVSLLFFDLFAFLISNKLPNLVMEAFTSLIV
jgi:hypothetical protein